MSARLFPIAGERDTRCEALLEQLSDFAGLLTRLGDEEAATHALLAANELKKARRPDVAQRMDADRLARVRLT